MKFSLESHSGNTIHSYQAGEITIVLGTPPDPEQPESALRKITENFILTPSELILNWIEPSEPLNQSHLYFILRTEPEIIILGTGEHLQFPAPTLLQASYEAGVGLEVMDTGAACRTYNILASEGRRVSAAIMAV